MAVQLNFNKETMGQILSDDLGMEKFLAMTGFSTMTMLQLTRCCQVVSDPKSDY
jgi:hypothetical protein